VYRIGGRKAGIVYYELSQTRLGAGLILRGFCFDWLLFKDQRRPADSLPLESDSYLDAIRDSDEGDTTIHPEVLAVERHRSANLA